MHDVRYLGLHGLHVERVSSTNGLEFYVHLRKPGQPRQIDDRAFYDERASRMRAVRASLIRRWRWGWRARRLVTLLCRAVLRPLKGRSESRAATAVGGARGAGRGPKRTALADKSETQLVL